MATFTRQVFTVPNDVANASLKQMLGTLNALWEVHRHNAGDAMGEAAIHHHLLLDIMDVSWPTIDKDAPVYWCVIDFEDHERATDAYSWTTSQMGDHNYGFMAVAIGPSDLDLRVVFVTLDETESVVFKTGFA